MRSATDLPKAVYMAMVQYGAVKMFLVQDGSRNPSRCCHCECMVFDDGYRWVQGGCIKMKQEGCEDVTSL